MNVSKLDGKEQRVNINMRVPESLKNKIKNTMEDENKSPDVFFSDMYYSYLKNQATANGEADFSTEILELEMVTKRMVTLFHSTIEKNFIHNSTVRGAILEESSLQIEAIKESSDKEIQKLKKEKESAVKEYDMIAEQTRALLDDNKNLKETLVVLESNNSKNEIIMATYVEQINSLKKEVSTFEEKLKNTTDTATIERLEIANEKALIEKDKYYQSIINNLNSNYNDLQLKYSASLSSKK